jgi:hypothetical protein
MKTSYFLFPKAGARSELVDLEAVELLGATSSGRAVAKSAGVNSTAALVAIAANLIVEMGRASAVLLAAGRCVVVVVVGGRSGLGATGCGRAVAEGAGINCTTALVAIATDLIVEASWACTILGAAAGCLGGVVVFGRWARLGTSGCGRAVAEGASINCAASLVPVTTDLIVKRGWASAVLLAAGRCVVVVVVGGRRRRGIGAGGAVAEGASVGRAAALVAVAAGLVVASAGSADSRVRPCGGGGRGAGSNQGQDGKDGREMHFDFGGEEMKWWRKMMI